MILTIKNTRKPGLVRVGRIIPQWHEPFAIIPARSGGSIDVLAQGIITRKVGIHGLKIIKAIDQHISGARRVIAHIARIIRGGSVAIRVVINRYPARCCRLDARVKTNRTCTRA